MPVTNVKSKWVGGDLYFYDKSNNEIFHIDGTNRTLVIPAGSSISGAGLGAALTPPAVPASTVAATNTTGHNAVVRVLTGTVTDINVNGVHMSSLTDAFVPAGDTIALTYTGAAPTWEWWATA